jgi:hypothetical protein
LVKSAERVEEKGDELPGLAKERSKEQESEVKDEELELLGIPHPQGFCMTVKGKGMREKGFAGISKQRG